MKTINKKDLSQKIFQRVSKAIPQKNLNDCVQVICEYLIEAAVENRTVSIHNLGTFSPYTQHSHVGLNIASGELQQVKPKRCLKFRSHEALVSLLKSKRAKFS